MKINHFTRNGLVALAAAATMTLGACKKSPDASTGDGGTAGSGDKGASAPASRDVAAELVGYWAPNKESLTSMMEEEMAGQFGGADGPGAAMAQKVLGPMVDAMMEFFVFHLTEDKAFVVGPEGYDEQGSYTIVSTDPATGAFVVETTEKGSGETDKSEGSVSGDTLTLTMDGQTMTMNRIDESEFEKRKAKAGDFNPQEILAPLMAELLGGLGGEGGAAPPAGLPPGIEIPEPTIPDEPN